VVLRYIDRATNIAENMKATIAMITNDFDRIGILEEYVLRLQQMSDYLNNPSIGKVSVMRNLRSQNY
jgi:hypothetical protein